MRDFTRQANSQEPLTMFRHLRLTLLIALCCARQLWACSPGPRTGYRTAPRHLNPLLQGQFIPAVSETTIGASGPSEGRVTKGSPAFSKLILNYNPAIVFVDSEGDASDRRMTQRCKGRLDLLAVMVANQWAGVRLRVTEAWEGIEGIHQRGSLHYEGRAVDITTSDKDKEKYGMLARLAVEAGFDWVFYKKKYYVHVSVRSDDADDLKHGGCFPGESLVISKDNRTLHMNELVPGDEILAADRYTGRLVYSDVIILMDRNVDVFGSFVKITTNSRTVTLTSNHMIYVISDVVDNSTIGRRLSPTGWRQLARPVFAGDVKTGQAILTKSQFESDYSTPALVVSTEVVEKKGVVAPLTAHGTVVVDGVVASCYSVFKNEPIAHASLSPMRTFKSLRGTNQKVGLHWYARTLETVARAFIPRSFFQLV